MSNQELEFEEQIERLSRKRGKERKEEIKATQEAQVESKAKIRIEFEKGGYSALAKKKEILDFERIEIEEIKAPLPIFSFEKPYKSHSTFKIFLEDFLEKEKDIQEFTKAIPKFNVFVGHKSLIKAAKNIVEFDIIIGKESKLYRIGIPVVQFSSYSIETSDKEKIAIVEAPREKSSEAKPEIPFEDFDDILKDEEKWITNANLVSQSSNILLVSGVEGMGFEVIKGLLRLELEDRGHEPNFKPINVSEEDKEEIKEISEIDDKTTYNRLISLEGSLDSWSDLKEKEDLISKELRKALSKGTIRYVVFENKISLDQINKLLSNSDLESLREEKEKALTRIKNLQDFPLKNINLIYPPENTLRDFDFFTPDYDKIILRPAKIFAKILQIKIDDKELDNVVAFKKIDSIWDKLFAKKDIAIKILLRKYNEPESEVRKILPFDEKLTNESNEHFVIKQLVVKELLKRKMEREIIPEMRKDDGANKKWGKIPSDGAICTKEIEVEREVRDENGELVKIPDVKVETQGKNIWIEVETCKTLEEPLEFVFEKLAKITKMALNDPEAPDELWIVFPYRKYFLYGAKQFEEGIRNFFMKWFKKTKKFKPRIFFADLYDERLVELKEKRD